MNSRNHENPLSPEDNQLLRAWHNGELDEPAADALEHRMFFEPALAEAAGIDQDIRDGIVGIRVDHTRSSQRRERLWPLLAAASIGALAVLAPMAYHETTQLEPTLLGNVEWVRLDYVRSAEASTPLVSPGGATGALVLEVPAPEGAGPFSATFLRGDNAALELRFDGLSPVDGALTLVVAREQLHAGAYRLIVQAGEDGKPSVLAFRYEP